MTGSATATRAAQQVAIVVAAVAAGALLAGNVALAAMLLVPVVGFGWLAVRHRRAEAAERPWSAPLPPGRGPGDPRAPARGAVIRSLGRVECRELLLSPWFGIGLGFCAVMVVAFASSYTGQETWWNVIQDLPFLSHPLVGLTVVTAHRAATRAERDGAAELLATLPASHQRTAGVLAAAPVPVVTLAVFCAGYLGVAAASGGVAGEIGTGAGPIVLSALALGAGGVALGVAVGRFARSPLAPIAVVVAIGFISLRLASGGPGELSIRMLLSTMPGLADDSPALTWQQGTAHLAWLLALTSATVAVALVRRGEPLGPRARRGASAFD